MSEYDFIRNRKKVVRDRVVARVEDMKSRSSEVETSEYDFIRNRKARTITPEVVPRIEQTSTPLSYKETNNMAMDGVLGKSIAASNAEKEKNRQLSADAGVNVNSITQMTNRGLAPYQADAKVKQDAAAAQQKAKQDAKAAERERNANLPGRDVPIIGGILGGLDRVSEFTSPYQPLLESLITPGGAPAAVARMSMGAINLVGKVLPKLANSRTGRTIQTGLAEAGVGAPLGVSNVLARDSEASGKEILEGAAYGAGGGALLGGGLRGASELRGFARDTVREGAERAAGNQINAMRTLDRVSEMPQYSGRLKLDTAGQNVDRIKTNVAPAVSEAMTPPLENVKLLREWVRPHLGNPSNSEMAKFSYEDLRQLAEEIRPTLNQTDIEMQLARSRGADLSRAYDEAPSMLRRVGQDATRRAFGGAEPSIPGIRRPFVNEPSPRPASSVPDPVATQAVPETPSQPATLRQTSQAGQSAPAVSNVAPTEGSLVQTPPKIKVRRTIKNEAPTKERGFAQTLIESEKTPQPFKDQLKTAFKPITNEETVAQANKRIAKDPESAASYVLGKSRFTAEKAATALRLIDHYNGKGNYQRAVDIAEQVSEEATRAGQSIQALSMFDRLTPQGVLIRAQRMATKTNESLFLGQKEVKVTPEMAENIMGLAQSSQKLTGVKDLSNNVQNILDKAKTGAKLTDTETADLKRFVSDSKQFIKEVSKPAKTPRPPQMPKDSRVKDNVVKFLDAQEQAAKDRLRARGTQSSSTPLDIWADYAIIGAAKMGKGTIKFGEWSAQMVKEFGDDIKPQLQHLYERSRQTFELSSKKITAQTISDAEKMVEKVIRTNAKLTNVEIDEMRSLAQKVSRLAGEEKNLASQDLQVIMQALDKPTFLRKVATAQTIGQLLNPKTQVRNSLGNELFYRLERLNKVVATPLDIARSKITGGARTVTFKTNNQGEYWKNWMRGAKAGWRRTNVNGIETQYDLGGPSFKSKYNPLTYLEKALGASLKSFDTAAYMRAYSNTLGEQATLRAINEGQKGNKTLIAKYIREADDNLMKMADEYGKYSTFQDNNAISKSLVALKKGMNFKKDFGIGDLILKYPKTPGALLHRALEYSPAGFVRSAAILSRPLLKKTPNTGEAMNALSRAIVGTAGLTGMGFFLFDKGVLTGSVSKDRDIRDLQKSTGQGQYQVNLSALIRLVKSGFKDDSVRLRKDDFLYTYDWMQPLSMAVSVGANIAKNFNSGEQKLSGLAGTAYNSLEGGLGTLTEQSVVQGLKRAAEGYPGQTITDKILDVLSDIPASFVPTFSNQIKQLGDNNKPETYDPSKLQTSLNRAQAKIPGLAQKLPIQYDSLGRKKEVYQDNSLFNVMFNPGFASRYKLTPEEQYIIDLIEETGDESLAPRVPGKKITVDGESIVLNGDMFSRIQQVQGEENREMIRKRMERDKGKKLGTRSNNISTGLTEAGSDARKQIAKELGIK